MAKVRVEEIINHLDHEIKRALDATLKLHFPNQEFDKGAIFKTFKRQVYRKCSTWENVPEDYVVKDK